MKGLSCGTKRVRENYRKFIFCKKFYQRKYRSSCFCRKAVMKCSKNFHESTCFSENFWKIFKTYFCRIYLDGFFCWKQWENILKNCLRHSTVHIFSGNFKSLWQNLHRSGGKKCAKCGKKLIEISTAWLFCILGNHKKFFSSNVLVETTEKHSINSAILKFQLCGANIW